METGFGVVNILGQSMFDHSHAIELFIAFLFLKGFHSFFLLPLQQLGFILGSLFPLLFLYVLVDLPPLQGLSLSVCAFFTLNFESAQSIFESVVCIVVVLLHLCLLFDSLDFVLLLFDLCELGCPALVLKCFLFRPLQLRQLPPFSVNLLAQTGLLLLGLLLLLPLRLELYSISLVCAFLLYHLFVEALRVDLENGLVAVCLVGSGSGCGVVELVRALH